MDIKLSKSVKKSFAFSFFPAKPGNRAHSPFRFSLSSSKTWRAMATPSAPELCVSPMPPSKRIWSKAESTFLPEVNGPRIETEELENQK